MVNTIDEVKDVFNNGIIDIMLDNNWVNSQNVSQYLFGDREGLLYSNMNSQKVMFNYKQYVNRIQNMHNIRACNGSFKDVYGERIWNSFEQIRKSSFGYGGLIVKSNNLKSVALIDYLLWYPNSNTVVPIIVIPVSYDYWDTNRMKSEKLPEMMLYNYLVVRDIASENGLKTKTPIMIIKDQSEKFVSFNMKKYIDFSVNQGDVLEAVKYIGKIIENGVTVRNNVSEGCLCLFE